MDKRFWAAAGVLLCLTIGFLSLAGAQAGKQGGLVITQSFASKEINTGGTWKIYLKASHPDGEMASIFATVDQPGVGQYPLSMMKLKEENRKEFSGFVYLSTSSPYGSLDGISLTLTIQIQDKSKTFSQPVVFPLLIQNRATQETPPPGVFKEQELGPVMVILRPVHPNKG
jgi:hypothetical protein